MTRLLLAFPFGIFAGLVSGCTGSIVGGSGNESTVDAIQIGSDAAAAVGDLTILAPAQGSVFDRTFPASSGRLSAQFEVKVGANPAVASLQIADAAGTSLGNYAISEPVIVTLATEGEQTLTVQGMTQSGEMIAQTSLSVVVGALPQPADCYGWLDAYGLQYEILAPLPGIDSPVSVTMPLNHVRYRYVESTEPRESFVMDCTLARNLAWAAPHMISRGIVEVVDLGLYNYRCINNNGTPPNCPDGISQHSYGKAIDFAGFVTTDGTYYSVLTDWVIDGDMEETCSATGENPKDAFLHDVICAQWNDGLWNTVLTPNYNAAHRNHFHCDLSPGNNIIHALPELPETRRLDTGWDGH